MVPLLSDVFTATRAVLGDDAIAAGEVFTDAVLQPHFARAYRAMYRAMATVSEPRIVRVAYHVVPVNTRYLKPSTANIADFKEPIFLEERGNLTEKTITGVSGTTTVTVTATTHTFSTGNNVTVNGVVGFNGTEGIWAITVSDANTFTLNGCVGSGTWASGGSAVKSGEEFVPMTALMRLERAYTSASGTFGAWEWRDGAMHFPPASARRQLKITYYASGTAPTVTTVSIGIDDSLDFLATYAAALAGGSRMSAARRRELLLEALGRELTEDGSGGLLWGLVNTAVKGLQRTPPDERRRLPFRDRRSATNINLF